MTSSTGSPRLSAHAPWIQLERFAADFVNRVAEADLLISMAGYNTCMNILTTGVKALVQPFTGNQNEEQTIRARKLEQLGFLGVLSDDDLAAERLACRIELALARPANGTGASLDLGGVAKTAMLLESVCAGVPAHV